MGLAAQRPALQKNRCIPRAEERFSLTFMNPRNFFAELKRRNVYKVAVAYAIVGWLVMQIAATVVPALHLSDAITSAVVVLTLLGFPIALVLAWAFDLTPEGLKRTEWADREPARPSRNKPWRQTESVKVPAKSIAVMPFENRSEDKANAYFADGVQDEILTLLSKIADLKVISRTSTQQYQGKPRNLIEIAKQLGVANILEGSVQKAGDQVRVNVQLVNAQTDSHLWAETYDRKLTDIFGVESEIAKGIAESLQAKLTGREEQALAVKPTNNLEAYEAYLRGLAFDGRSASSYGSYSPYLVGRAAGFFERAVQLDPNFVLAWARLSRAHAAVYFVGTDTTAARRDTAKTALETAQQLQPNSPETQLALGYYQYYVPRDYGLAKSTFGLVGRMLPGSSEVSAALAFVARREGHWDESIAYWEEALALDPRNVEFLNQTAITYTMLRQFPTALKLHDRALDIVPN